MKKCDIVIPVWNEPESTRRCITELKKHTRYPYRLIVVDNGSGKDASDYLESLKDMFSDFLLIRNSNNLGFVKAVNQGLVASRNPYVCLLNNDSYVTEGWLTFLIETVESRPRNIGIANPTSNVFGKDAPDGERLMWQELDSCKGFCMLIRREVIETVGLFDEIYGMGYFEEKDFSRRAIGAGYICIRSKASYVYHRDRLSFDKLSERDELFARNEKIYDSKWGRPLNIAVIERENKLNGRKEFLYGLLEKGHRIHIFFDGRKEKAHLKDHINIKYFPVPEAFFPYVVLFKLRERRRKKKVELIVTDKEDELRFFKRFRFVHGAEVMTGDMCRAVTTGQ